MALYLATNSGVVDAQGNRLGLQEQRITTLSAREGVILAGTETGIYRSDDGGESWIPSSEGILLPHARWLAYHPDVSGFQLVGTEPAAIFVSLDGGASWRECPEVTEMRRENGWYLPYSPEAGCIRGFAIHGKRAYASAEDGAVLRSDDGGNTWALAPGSAGPPLHDPPAGQVHSDNHSITVHPSSPDLVLASTGGGLYYSGDGGETWENRYRCYCRASWWDPLNPDHIIFGPADGVDRNGRLEESRDGGQTWQRLTQTVWRDYMVERIYKDKAAERLLILLSNGELLQMTLDGSLPKAILLETGWVNDLAFL